MEKKPNAVVNPETFKDKNIQSVTRTRNILT